MALSRRTVGLRSQDIQTGLQEVDLRGPATGLLNNTLIVGMAERLAIHVRGINVIEDEARLYALADRLGINGLVLPNVLHVLEDVGFASVTYESGRIRRVAERIPYFEDIYDTLGEVWEQRNPREEEHATIQLLEGLADGPRAMDDIQGDYGVDTDELRLILEVGRSGGYFSEFDSETDHARVVYSPLFWEEKPAETFALVSKYGGSRVADAIRRVRSYQGLPLPDLGSASSEGDRIVVEAMAAGLLPAPQVQSAKGPKRFAFTPYQGQQQLSEVERPVLQKARAILACIRYGQHFGSASSIFDPGAIINALRVKGRIGPHSEIARQYAMLVVENVGRITRDPNYTSRYNLEIIQTEENVKALRLAADMVKVGEAISDRGLDQAARSVLFATGTFREPATVRTEELARRRREPEYSQQSIRRLIEQLVDDVRQV